MTLCEIERRRQDLQQKIDAAKDLDSRRRMGQFATPNTLARQIVHETIRYLPKKPQALNVLEPSMGTGSFVSAALQGIPNRVREIRGYELDPDFFACASRIWSGMPVETVNVDFTKADPKAEYDVVFSNPPYVRHHAIDAEEKRRLQQLVKEAVGVQISGLAGLYCHFLLLSTLWMRPGAVAAWLIPSEWMSVNYGSALRSFLTQKAELLRIHRFDADDVRFSDALVSSCVVWFRKAAPCQAEVLFTFGPDIERPQRSRSVSVVDLSRAAKWPPRTAGDDEQRPTIGSYFDVRRGIATGDNGFFVLQEEFVRERGISSRFLHPILPSPRHVPVERITADGEGIPTNVRRQFLFDCTGLGYDDLPVSARNYLLSGEETTGRKNLCASRHVWYEQEQRKPARFLCSYMGRSANGASPVRFILNESDAIATNSFLMLYPKGDLKAFLDENPDRAEAVWRSLKRISPADVMSCGRTYGGGLYKVEPKELARVPCQELASLMRDGQKRTI